jgi:hypothetical protein
MRDIETCRTAVRGGQLRACDRCHRFQYAYHSCRNRHCPKCHTDQTRRWLERQRDRLLPCRYFLATFTLPAEIRPVARSRQKLVYGLLMRCPAEALLKLTADPDLLGARPGLLGVLHTWTRALIYHPHVHFLVTAGGLSPDESRWIPAKRPDFLVPARRLSIVFRAKLRDAFRHAGLAEHVPPQPAFIARFLQHVLPQGFSKVRHYGLFSPARYALLERARAQIVNDLGAEDATHRDDLATDTNARDPTTDHDTHCPFCGLGLMRIVAWLPRPSHQNG